MIKSSILSLDLFLLSASFDLVIALCLTVAGSFTLIVLYMTKTDPRPVRPPVIRNIDLEAEALYKRLCFVSDFADMADVSKDIDDFFVYWEYIMRDENATAIYNELQAFYDRKFNGFMAFTHTGATHKLAT